MSHVRPLPAAPLARRLQGGWLALAMGLGALAAGAGAAAILGCHPRQAKAPDWVLTAPASTVMAVSGQAGWVLEQPQFQTFLERYPLADQTLDLFLKRAHINPHQETGRITFYVLNLPVLGNPGGVKPDSSDFLIQLGGFQDSGALQVAISDAFPAEGSLPIEGRELPLYVVLDLNQYHIRVVTDSAGRVWLGDLGALARLGSGRLPPRNPVALSAEWVNGNAPFQGYLRPQGILAAASSHLPAERARNLPQGIESLAWSVTPGTGKDQLHRFELAITGSKEGVLQVAPWLQRFVAAATAMQGAPSQPPEILQETRRIGLRAQLTQNQVNTALSKLSQPGISWVPAAKPAKP